MKNLLVIPFLLFTLLAHFAALAQSDLELTRDSIANSIGINIENSLGSGEPDYVTSVVDKDYLLGKFFIFDESNRELTKLNKDVKNVSIKGIFNGLAKGMVDGVNYNFIHYYSDDENINYYLTFRLYGDEGLNYHEYHLRFDESNNTSILDMHVLLTGELLSETLSKIYLPNVQRILEKDNLSSQKIEEIESYEKLAKIFNLIKKGNKIGAWLLFCSIPEEIRNRKNFIIAELRILDPEISEKAVIDAISRLNKLYPNNSSGYLYRLTLYSLQEDYDKALLMADSLATQVGDDFLDYYKGDLCFAKQDYTQAQKYYSQLVTNYPNFEDGIYSLLTASTRLKDYESAVYTLQLLMNLDYPKENIIIYIEEESEYKKFKKSKAYNSWKKND